MTILYESLPQYSQHLLLLMGGEADCVSTVDGLARAVAGAPDEVLVVCGPSVPLSEVVGFAAAHRLTRPALGVVLLRQHLDLNVLAEALRSGVREVADVADPQAVLAACARSVELSRQLQSTPQVPRQAAVPEPERDAKVVTVFAAK